MSPCSLNKGTKCNVILNGQIGLAVEIVGWQEYAQDCVDDRLGGAEIDRRPVHVDTVSVSGESRNMTCLSGFEVVILVFCNSFWNTSFAISERTRTTSVLQMSGRIVSYSPRVLLIGSIFVFTSKVRFFAILLSTRVFTLLFRVRIAASFPVFFT